MLFQVKFFWFQVRKKCLTDSSFGVNEGIFQPKNMIEFEFSYPVAQLGGCSVIV